ncbi:MAG: hypothetical protein ACD_70C00099G0001 [uncultured bacterium]|nr:MAG: hypothetical protein ACD_70C00099G0001 [uncultured bacterium]
MTMNSGKMKSLIVAALFLPLLLVFGLRGLPSTDRPVVEDFAATTSENRCSYLQCPAPSTGTFDVRVTTGTDAEINKTIILVEVRKYPLCEDHATYAKQERWPMHGWKFAAMLALALGLCAFLSVCIFGAGLFVFYKTESEAKRREGIAQE